MTKKIAITNQALFDECATHILKQGSACVASNGACVYLSEDGTKSCAIGGPLVARGLYSKTFDSGMMSIDAAMTEDWGGDTVLPVDRLDFFMALSLWGVHEKQLPLLSSIQKAHDYNSNESAYKFAGKFRESMQTVAREFNLSAAVVR